MDLKSVAKPETMTPKKATYQELIKSWEEDPKTVVMYCIFGGHELPIVPNEKQVIEVDGKHTVIRKAGVNLKFGNNMCKMPVTVARHIMAYAWYKRDYCVKDELNEALKKQESWAKRFLDDMKMRAEAQGRKLKTKEEVTL